MPCISDPGADIVQRQLQEGFAVVPVPGANAAIKALIASGLTPQPFFFYGFLSRNKKERKAEIEKIAKKTGNVILYEAPHRLKETLRDMQSIMVWNSKNCISTRANKEI